MTAQRSDILVNDSDIEFGCLQPYFVQRPDRSNAFPVPVVLPESNRMCSALWRGYVATMRLHPDGRLELEEYAFPFAAPGTPPQRCNALFEGNFAITLRPFFFGPSTEVPFHRGRIASDPDEWTVDDRAMAGVVASLVLDEHTSKPLGLFVDIMCPAFVPLAFVPAEHRTSLETLVGQSVQCRYVDQKNNVIVVRVEKVG